MAATKYHPLILTSLWYRLLILTIPWYRPRILTSLRPLNFWYNWRPSDCTSTSLQYSTQYCGSEGEVLVWRV